MKELSIYISQSNMNGFSYAMRKNSLLLYRRDAREGDTFYSVIENELSSLREELRIVVIWNNRTSLLIPSIYFKIDNLYSYIGSITSIIYKPQCLQYGEIVIVWNTDERMDEFDRISSEFGISIHHTHQRVEHIANTPDDAISFVMTDNLLYISEKVNGVLKNSFVAEVSTPDDVLYYILKLAKINSKVIMALPNDWVSYIESKRKVQ